MYLSDHKPKQRHCCSVLFIKGDRKTHKCTFFQVVRWSIWSSLIFISQMFAGITRSKGWHWATRSSRTSRTESKACSTWSLSSTFVYWHVASLCLHVACLIVSIQGAKGEPGFLVAADGSVLSGLAGPLGPKGTKVLHLLSCSLFSMLVMCW